jgi:hypothetical protein
MSILTRFSEILTQEQIECAIHPPTTEVPQEVLLIALGVDSHQREQTIQVTAQEQMLDINPSQSNTQYYRVQFYYTFPFPISETAFMQVNSLVLFLNHHFDFPGIEVDELYNQLSYRYVWMTTQNIDNKLFISVIGMISLMIELFSVPLEKVANGTATFNDLLEEMMHNKKDF